MAFGPANEQLGDDLTEKLTSQLVQIAEAKSSESAIVKLEVLRRIVARGLAKVAEGKSSKVAVEAAAWAAIAAARKAVHDKQLKTTE
jgi:hypothetical protein